MGAHSDSPRDVAASPSGLPSADSVAVKVCGITRPEDVRALDARVGYLGFNFWPRSKRYVDPSTAARLIRDLKHAVPVGVFVDHTAAEIDAIARETGIRWAQLHGSEGWETLDALDLPVIKAIPQDRIADWGGLKDGWDAHAGKQPRYFLVDSKTEKGFGGTGSAFDWGLLSGAEGFAEHGSPLPRPYFLAGGIGPDNLADALHALGPHGLYGVDLNSRVESAPGLKDAALVERCLETLRSR